MAMNNGGPAFPQNDLSAYGMGPCEVGNDGMSLRDWFAGQALAHANRDIWAVHKFEDVAKRAYMYADAMLAARQSDAEREG